MPGDSTIRIGFVGAGVIAWGHALSLRGLIHHGLIDAKLAVAHDTDAAKVAELATRFHLDVVADATEVAAACDAVFVCTSTAGHLEAVAGAAGFGRAIFCEKPLARSLAEADSLVRLVRDAGVPAQAGLVLRTAPVYRELRRLVAEGTLGRAMVATLRDDQYFPIQGHYASTWRADVEIAGAGALLEHSIHDLDIIRVCFGEVASLSALTENFAGHDGIEDAAAGLVRLESGLAVTLVSAWHSVMSRPSTRRVEVIFERGFVELVDDFTGPITIQTSDGVEIRECAPPEFVSEVRLPEGSVGLAVRPYLEEDHDFVHAVNSGAQPEPSLEEALVAHRMVDAWYRSAAMGGGAVRGPW